jgi:hypothetical protein
LLESIGTSNGITARAPVGGRWRIDFCEADVLDVFDEWRRATGLAGSGPGGDEKSPPRRGPSLPEHLERVLLKLTNAQATGVLGASLDPLIDQLSAELDRARAASGGVRGEARRAMSERLAAADASLLAMARPAVGPEELESMRLGRRCDPWLGCGPHGAGCSRACARTSARSTDTRAPPPPHHQLRISAVIGLVTRFRCASKSPRPAGG